MTAADRVLKLDALPATEICAVTQATLDRLVSVLNEETTLLRAGKLRDAAALTPEKTRLAQDYVGLARAIERQLERLRNEAPDATAGLQHSHDRLITQMADNLKVIATARNLTEEVISDVARAVNPNAGPRTYGAGGIEPPERRPGTGIAINRAL